MTTLTASRAAAATAAPAPDRSQTAAVSPAVYEAMFQLPIEARFAQEDNEAELRSGFDALTAVLADGDGTATEVLWSALHGMSQLERAGRMLPEQRRNRVADLAARFG